MLRSALISGRFLTVFPRILSYETLFAVPLQPDRSSPMPHRYQFPAHFCCQSVHCIARMEIEREFSELIVFENRQGFESQLCRMAPGNGFRRWFAAAA
jgi:hypothetical protein